MVRGRWGCGRRWGYGRSGYGGGAGLTGELQPEPERKEGEEALGLSGEHGLQVLLEGGIGLAEQGLAQGVLGLLREPSEELGGQETFDWDRDGLEKLARYCARPSFAEQRLSQTEKGQVLYVFPKPTVDGQLYADLLEW